MAEIEIVQLLDGKRRGHCELEYHAAASRFEHTQHFAQSRLKVLEVANSESHSYGVESVVAESV